MKLGDDFRFLLSKIKPQPLWIQGKGHLAVIQVDRRPERLINPTPQVAVDEQLIAQQSHQIGEAPVPGAAQLQVAQYNHGDQRRPDLHPHGVLAGPDKGLDAQ
jgi:hypothetical protein